MIIGIDPSLASTGVSDGKTHMLIETKPGSFPPNFDTYYRIKAQMMNLEVYLLDRAGPYKIFVEDVKKSMAMKVPEGETTAVGVSHLFEMGFWFSQFIDLCAKLHATPYFVHPATLKSFVSDKGNMSKGRMMTIVYKKWGIDFGEESDPGLDKLHAFCLYKYGCAVEAGEIEHVESHRRGQGTKAVSKRRARSAAS